MTKKERAKLLAFAEEFFSDTTGELDSEDIALFLSELNDGEHTDVNFDGVCNISSNEYYAGMATIHSDKLGKAIVLDFDVRLYRLKSVEEIVDYIEELEETAKKLEQRIDCKRK